MRCRLVADERPHLNAGCTEQYGSNIAHRSDDADGTALDPSMPWQYYAQMTDLELRAIWSFLQYLQPVQSGTR